MVCLKSAWPSLGSTMVISSSSGTIGELKREYAPSAGPCADHQPAGNSMFY